MYLKVLGKLKLDTDVKCSIFASSGPKAQTKHIGTQEILRTSENAMENVHLP